MKKILLFVFLLDVLASFAQTNRAEKDSLAGSKAGSDRVLQEVVVSSRRKDENVTARVMGVEKLTIAEIKLMPALMGEVDVLKAIQLLPGVQATSEGSSGFSVRGGSPDQNLIVFDNTTVYNPSHQLGFFSAFNNDVISGIELSKGHFPFRHGGRLSSLLEVNSRNEIPSKVQGTGGIGIISSRLMVEGPLGEKTTWMAAARRTYADLFLVFASNEDLRKSSLYFYDLNGKLTHRFSPNDKLELMFYNGSDNMSMAIGKFKYGNTATSLTWSHTFSKNLFGKFSTHWSDYQYLLAGDMSGLSASWKSGISDVMLRADFRQPVNELWDFSYGVSGTHHNLNLGKIFVSGVFQNDSTFWMPQRKALEYAAYVSNDQKLTNHLSLNYGLRFSAFQNMGNVQHLYTAWEPGVAFVYKLTDVSSVKAGYSHHVQYLQLAKNSASGSPLDVWFPAGPDIRPQEVDLFSAGYFHN
ncbi:MAG: TonB-dependent receptor, partial [Dysgonamonadaceae bacterium]|nr:TonB-dependent receptor [Dysgonamonadaceae bacterium]